MEVKLAEFRGYQLSKIFLALVEWRWSESRKLAYGSQESYYSSYPSQLTKTPSNFRWSEIFLRSSHREMSWGSTNAESNTTGFMSDTWQSFSLPLMRLKSSSLSPIRYQWSYAFGIIDLTQRYHQAPLSDTTKAYAAFITFSRVYVFTRILFRPRCAPSYFQEIVATILSVSLIYVIREMNIDDCSVFGDTNIEFILRLRSVIGRFRKDNLYPRAIK